MVKIIRKDQMLNRRFKVNKTLEAKEYEFWRKYGNWVCAFIIAVLAIAVAEVTFYRAIHKPLVDPRGLGEVKIVKEVWAVEKDWNTDLIGYFRHRGEELGYDQYLITRLHGVMDCENGLHTADRVNYLYDGENGHYTAVGFAMITKSTFNDPQFKCAGDRFNGVDNINCFWKIYAKTGLKRYFASKHCWGK